MCFTNSGSCSLLSINLEYERPLLHHQDYSASLESHNRKITLGRKVNLESMKTTDDFNDATTLNNSMVVTTDSVPEPTAKEESELLAKELNAMSFNERERMYEEIHGIDQEFIETPQLIATCLAEFELELQNLKQKPAYNLACDRSTNFVADPKLRLMFLRCERFNVKKAARRLAMFLEYKLDLFGPDKLVKKITLADLSLDDLEPLNCGAMQLLPTRDKAGRAVVMECQKYWQFQEPDNLVRKGYLFEYSIWSLLRAFLG